MPEPGPPISEFRVRGSRPETENKGLEGSRARTVPAARPLFPNLPDRGSHVFSSVKLLLQLTLKNNPLKNNFEKIKKSTGQEGSTSV